MFRNASLVFGLKFMAKKEKTIKESKPLLVLSHKAAFGLSGLILFSFISIFIIGTLVGRGRISMDLEKDKLALEIAGFSKSNQNSSARGSNAMPGNKDDFDFYEALETPKRNKPAKKRSPAKHKIKKVKKNKHVATVPPVTPVLSKKKENSEKQIRPVKLATTEPSLYKYTIQAASFKTREDAEKMVNNLKKRGYPAYTVKALVRNNELWYRVWIGSFRDRIDAKNTIGRLKKDNIDTFLVNRQEKQ